ncbi:hypothetical protein LTR02_005616 [Friedmanniomyces endolithicus]|nr:hypothetical protein LTR94_012999 [Friedmanniomyces endolithicus]KAK0813433.1 hypothetical protein LTR59_001219 [Friedmanniomyces endolithicus]KAK0821417.1 hypothetical protein LTR75_000892 [Friedmanniomyces endolithicus]KAK0833357.1 hypothetical protein LTR03_014845 [Friedmanniomyces endolithicus]KAK0907128.1 hypothetical protein LTR02_005616 [Friedmanniomyces endolithicus]
MSKAASSPTARLLQDSRLFSLPRPLPQPALESATSTGLYRASDTATLPYPTHQAIATPAASHFRGDWGLKRALPKKATNSSTPHIRVRAQDNTEHITDFGSAADHTQTRAKWLEMGVPVWYKRAKASGASSIAPPASVFDDVTSSRETKGAPRWRYDGPWLAGMQDGDFERYLSQLSAKRNSDGRRDVKGRSRVDDFREYVKDRLVEQDLVPARREAQEGGEILNTAKLNAMRQELRPDDVELDRRLQDLRHKHSTQSLSSDLTAYMTAFLDLPAVHNPIDTGIDVRTPMLRAMVADLAFDDAGADKAAPPSTHPAAGLSYLRTNAVMANHPLHGPQAHRSPVLARVVRPKAAGGQGPEYRAKLGVGGVVCNDPVSSTWNPNSTSRHEGAGDVGGYNPDKMAQQLDMDLAGGNKMWVQPQHAWIDETGRIRLEVTRGDKEAAAVKLDGMELESIHQARAGPTEAPSRGVLTMPTPPAPPGTAGNANFGHGLPDMRRFDRSPEQGVRGQKMPDFSSAGLGGRKDSDLVRLPPSDWISDAAAESLCMRATTTFDAISSASDDSVPQSRVRVASVRTSQRREQAIPGIALLLVWRRRD